jgi:hypothetical protein
MNKPFEVIKNKPLKAYFRHQWYTIHNIKKNMLSLTSGGSGDGKCQKKGSLVLMSNGIFKKIEDIKKGDKIVSLNKNNTACFSTVTDINSYDNKELFEVRERKRNKKLLYECTGNHQIPIIETFYPKVKGKRLKELKYNRLKNYTAEDFSKLSKAHTIDKYGFSLPKILEFENRKNPEVDAYILGVFLGDGHFIKYRNERRSHNLGITTADFEIVEEISKKYPIMSLQTKKDNAATTYYFSVNSELSKHLDSFGLADKKSGDKFIPDSCKYANYKFRTELLSGLIDTDGDISKTGAIHICTKSIQLAEDIKFIVHSLGGYADIMKIKKGIKERGFVGNYFNISICFKERNLTLRVKHKKERYEKIMFDAVFHVNKTHVGINVIKTNKTDTVYGITVDSPTALYITNEFMVTHNSWATIIHNYFLDPTFNLDKVVWNESQFYNALDNIKYVGEFVMWDEAGIGIPSKEWWSVSNRAIGKTLQIFRADRRIGLTFTTQDLSFIDSQSRKLLNYFFMMDKRTSPDYSKMWVREIMVNRYLGKMYMPYPRLKVDGIKYRFKSIGFDINQIRKIPDLESMLDEYDKKSRPVKKKLRIEHKMLIEKYKSDAEKKAEEKAMTKFDILTKLRDKIMNLPEPYLNAAGYLDTNIISTVEGISMNDAISVKKLCDKELKIRQNVPTS